MEQEFKDYLLKKKIDPEAFLSNEPDTYNSFRDQFLHIHPHSFTMQKLFLINVLRRKYHYQGEAAAPAGSVKEKAKPVVRKPLSTPKTSDSGKASKPVVKPKASKPVIPGKSKSGPGTEAAEGQKKPQVKPKIRPKAARAEDQDKEQAAKPKPVIKKPVVKPKIKPPSKAEEPKQEEPQNSQEKKKVKPVIKPRIPKKDN